MVGPRKATREPDPFDALACVGPDDGDDPYAESMSSAGYQSNRQSLDADRNAETKAFGTWTLPRKGIMCLSMRQ
ncbi:hypothetical protein LTS12_025241, partial [Elasticomyces elasticus]